MLKNFSLDKTNGTKKYSFFFRELRLMKVLLLIRDLYIITIFDSVSLLIKFIFFNKKHGLFDFKTS